MGIYEWIDRETLRGVAALVIGFVLTERVLKPKEQHMPLVSLAKVAALVGGIKYLSDEGSKQIVGIADQQQQSAASRVVGAFSTPGAGLQISSLADVPSGESALYDTPTL